MSGQGKTYTRGGTGDNCDRFRHLETEKNIQRSSVINVYDIVKVPNNERAINL